MGVSLMWGDCQAGVGRLSERYGDAVWRVWGSCLEGVGRLSGWSGEAVCMVLED